MVFIPRYHYSAVIWCEPIIWCFMAAELVISLYQKPLYGEKGRQETDFLNEKLPANARKNLCVDR